MNMSVSILQNAMAVLFVLNIEKVDIFSVSYHSFLRELITLFFFLKVNSTSHHNLNYSHKCLETALSRTLSKRS